MQIRFLYWLLLLVFFISFKGFAEQKQDSSILNIPLKSFPMIQNHKVQQWVYHFSSSQDIKYMKLWLKRSYRYFPAMKEILNQKNLPEDLVYMTLIESSLSPRAVSSANAVGYWQFIKPTALRFGLRINNWIDERKDFEKSTQAAARYISFLYKEFDDWLLVMAAYNMGEKRLNSLIRKYNTKNFWDLANKHDFPKETASYVPKILAASNLIKYPERYGFNRFKILTPYKYDVFFIPGGTNISKLCNETALSCSQFKILNPDLKSHRIPNTIPHHRIRIPEGKGLELAKWLKKNQIQL